MTIVTRRTLLVPYTDALESEFLMLNCCAKNRAQMNGPKTVASARRLFKTVLHDPDMHSMAVLDNYNREYMGHVVIETYRNGDAELSYLFDKAYWGNGYASEALKAYFPHICKQLALSMVVAKVNIGHEPSIAILNKLGFKLQGKEENEFGPYYRFEWYQRPVVKEDDEVASEIFGL